MQDHERCGAHPYVKLTPLGCVLCEGAALARRDRDRGRDVSKGKGPPQYTFRQGRSKELTS